MFRRGCIPVSPFTTPLRLGESGSDYNGSSERCRDDAMERETPRKSVYCSSSGSEDSDGPGRTKDEFHEEEVDEILEADDTIITSDNGEGEDKENSTRKPKKVRGSKITGSYSEGRNEDESLTADDTHIMTSDEEEGEESDTKEQDPDDSLIQMLENEYRDAGDTNIFASIEGAAKEGNTENEETDPIKLNPRFERFSKFAVELRRRFESTPFPEPSRLKNRCNGVGPAPEVWSLMCHKDDLHSICNEHFMRDHNPRDPYPPHFRAILVDWMQSVCAEKKLDRETCYRAIDYADRFMTKGPQMGVVLPKEKYQLLGATAMYVAFKYEEVDPVHGLAEELADFTDGSYTSEKIRRMEMRLLKVLEWELGVVTPLHWAHLFLELLTGKPKTSAFSSRFSQQSQAGFYSEAVPTEMPVTEDSGNIEYYMYMAYIMDTVMLHDQCRKYANRVLAAAVLFVLFDDHRDAIQDVTGLSHTDATLEDATKFVFPVVLHCEEKKQMPDRQTLIRGDKDHVTQWHPREVSTRTNVIDTMKEIERLRKEIDDERTEKEKIEKKEKRKRRLTTD